MLCKNWPKCRCIAQGYVNDRERNDCGRKPRGQATMTPTQKSLLSGAHGEVSQCLHTLRQRAMHGAKAKPTVSELNNLLQRLENAQRGIEQALVSTADSKAA
jgi:hypothetical protein